VEILSCKKEYTGWFTSIVSSSIFYSGPPCTLIQEFFSITFVSAEIFKPHGFLFYIKTIAIVLCYHLSLLLTTDAKGVS